MSNKIMISSRNARQTLVTSCSAPRSFGAGTPVAAPSTRFPSSHSYGYASQSKHALRTTTDAPSSEILVRNAG